MEMTNSSLGSEVAIVGFAGRFPGAPNVEAFWENLQQGVESVRFRTFDELHAEGVPRSLIDAPNFVPAVPEFADMAAFDAPFFGFSPRDAEIMDPQHRIFLEVAWHAFEHAGYAPMDMDAAVGVYAGVGPNDYYVYNLLRNQRLMDNVGEFLVRHTSNDKDFFATRLSYLLDLRGPSVNVQTACSTSLVAVHLAAQALINGECDMALAGGATILTRDPKGYVYREGEILSRDGHCRAFDAKASGTLFGSGAGAVILKRLDDALANRDTIYAVIRGSAINNDGTQKAGYMAPSVDGQAAAISEAIAVSGVDASTITYVEAHGTGTNVGDPIEVAALSQAFRMQTAANQYCGLGSVKSNIGHLDHAAGVSSLIKAVLALHHKQIPPSINYETPNPKLQIGTSPFYVNDTLQAWTPPRGVSRRAGVNSLGIGGTNAFLVLEEGPSAAAAPTSRRTHVLTLSARTESALDAATDALAETVCTGDTPLADVAYTLMEGRVRHEHRRALVVREDEEPADALQSLDNAHIATDRATVERSVAMMFSGQGAQYAGMGRGLYDTEPVFRDAIDACAHAFQDAIDIDLRCLLFPDGDAEKKQADAQLAQTLYTQPALFAVQVATTRLWQSWGIEPAALIGHSIGEYAAAHVAGVMTLVDACRLVAARGRLMQAMEPGAMLSVALAPSDLVPYLRHHPDASVSVINHPSMTVVGGPDTVIHPLRRDLDAADVPCRPLRTSHAFHSAMMEPALAPFRAEFGAVRLQPPQIPMVSNVSGTWLTDKDATDPEYWVRHIREPVRFADGMQTLLRETNAALLEVGPGNTLVTLAQRHPAATKDRPAIASLRHPKEDADDAVFIHRALGALWTVGVAVQGASLYPGEARQRVSIPRYPFQRTEHWIGPDPASSRSEQPDGLIRKNKVDDFFYVPSWERSTAPAVPDEPESGGTWLVFDDDAGRTSDLVQQALCAYNPPEGPAQYLAQEASGDLDTLVLAPTSRQAPEAGEVEIRVHAAALQFKDVLLALGVYAEDPVPMGAECAGTVVRVGDDVTEFAVGDSVIAAGFDSFRTHVTRDARTVVHRPDGLSFAEAVTLPSGFLTAYHSLVRVADLQAGDRVFIQSATGGVGQSAIQIARMLGADIYAAAGSETRRNELRDMGLDHVYDSRSVSFAENVLKDTGDAGVDVAIGAFTGDLVDAALSMLAPGGRFLELGKTDLYTPETLPDVRNRDTIRYAVIDMDMEREEQTDAFQTLFEEIAAHVEAGRLAPLPHHTYPWTQAGDAFRLMSQTKHIGKVVLELVPERPRVVMVQCGPDLNQKSSTEWTARADVEADVEAILEAIGPDSLRRVVHGWAMDNVHGDEAEQRCFTHLFHLAKALQRQSLDHSVPTTVFSTALQRVGMEEKVVPEKSLLLGPVRVVPHEHPETPMRSVDIASGRHLSDRQKEAVSAEIWLTGNVSADPVVAYRGTDRWISTVRPATINPSTIGSTTRNRTRGVLRLQQGGVYVITGGTGAIGLELARHLTARSRPSDNLTVVLMSRSGLPGRGEWARVLHERPDHDRTARGIRTVLLLESRGVTIELPRVNITDEAAVQGALVEISQRHGPIRGVLHTAGVVDDAPVALKSEESATRVLAPKVRGTQVLNDKLGDAPLDFFVLFSSVSAVAGLPGQVDYTAANAYLDAFAQQQRVLNGRPVTAIDWSAWQEVGMAAEFAGDNVSSGENAPSNDGHASHPMFDQVAQTDTATVFSATWSPRRFWVLDGHRNDAGDAVLPATGTFDLAWTAGIAWAQTSTIALRDLYFLAPLELTGGEPHRVRLTIEADGAFVLESQPENGPVMSWTEHATGRVDTHAAASDQRNLSFTGEDLNALRMRCKDVRQHTVTDRLQQEKYLRFGPEWRCLQEIRYGERESIAELELDPVFASELEDYVLHPALLDMAMSFGLPLLSDYGEKDFYVPMSCDNFAGCRPLPQRVTSVIQLRDDATQDVAAFDIALFDEDGELLVWGSKFQMKRVPASALSARQTQSTTRIEGLTDPLVFDLRLGLRPEESMQAFDRAVNSEEAQVMVSAVDIPEWLARIRTITQPSGEADAAEVSAVGGDPIPGAVDVRATHRPPRDEVETFLADVWNGLLGTTIGLDTDFFDAGGHSLIAVRMFAKIRKAYNVDLPLSVLMQATTLETFAEEVRDRLGFEAPGLSDDLTEDGTDGSGMQDDQKPSSRALRIQNHREATETTDGASTKERERNGTHHQKLEVGGASVWSPLVPIRGIQQAGDGLPFFCVHGAGGNILNFQHLGTYLDSDQPFYGLQARGVDGLLQPHASIEEMAQEYIDAIRTVQPEGPYLLGGFSAGGVVAFEMAHRMKNAGEEVGLLALLDTFCPDLPADPKSSTTERLTDHIGNFLKMGLSYGESYAKQRLAHEKFRLRKMKARAYERTGQSIPVELRDIGMIEAFGEAANAYELQPYDGRVVLFTAADKGPAFSHVDLDMGWSEYVQGDLTVYPISGTHDDVMTEPNVQALVEALTKELEALRS